ncbi:hypothetical protein [Paracoccus pantotrophus]|uniref:hypothetical protein n=1 Tax=Paracoccus pantotrophus TaxID=82367 RepID=UPI00048F11AE|nr:hypothetical protein [Paracoccus pantotrophus]
MEAGTGIEPVFTDLQSSRLRNENRSLIQKKYQDKPGTPGEPDTVPFRPIGDFATAFLDRIEENARRQAAARHLINAALNCGKDSLRFLEIIHAELSPGHPIPNPYGLMTEAREWASWASTAERKAYALACYEALPPADQVAFLSHVSGEEAA